MADIIVLDTYTPSFMPRHNLVSNLVYSASGRDVGTLIVGGKIIMEERCILTVKEEEVLQ